MSKDPSSSSSTVEQNLYPLSNTTINYKDKSQDELNELLLQSTIKTNKDLNGIKLALEHGANASFTKRIPGTWGAPTTVYGPIHNILEWDDNEYQIKYSTLALLLSKGAKVDDQAFEKALYDDNFINLFLEYGANPDTCIVKEQVRTMRYYGHSSVPILNRIIERNYLDVFESLLKYNVNVNVFSIIKGESDYGDIEDTKESPLHVVCNYFRGLPNNPNETDLQINDILTKMVSLLLKHHANVNCYGQKVIDIPNEKYLVFNLKNVYIKYTPLHLAIKNQNEELYNTFLLNGANSYLNYIKNNQHVTTSELLKEYNLNWKLYFEWTPKNHKYLPIELKNRIKTLQYCSSYLNWSLNSDILSNIYTFICLEYIVVKYKEMNRQELNTLLYEYSINKDLNGIKLALEHGANPSINKQVDNLGNCTLHGPIHIILQWVNDDDEKRYSALELLLSKGANIC